MRIIGIIILKETPRTLRKCLEPGWYPFIKSKLTYSHNDFWPLYDKARVPDNFFRLKNTNPLQINVSAVVGKNGTGKSTIVELLLAIINNVSMRLSSIRRKEDIEKNSEYVYDIYADVFYELGDKTYCIKIRNVLLSIFEKNDTTGKTVLLSEETIKNSAIRDLLAKHFFYTISINYGLHSFNSNNARNQIEKWNDDHRDLWFDKYFHRVDGYTIPLTLVPDRNKGVIDINKEEDLARKRLAKIAIWLKIRNQNQLIEGYEPSRLIWIKREWEDKNTRLLIERLLFDKKPDTEQSKRMDKLISELRTYWISKLNNNEKSKLDNTLFQSTINYLVYKTIKICVNYPAYGDYLFKYSTTVYNYGNIKRVVDALTNDTSHIATKIRSTISFLSSDLYTSKLQSVEISELLKNLDGKKTLEEIEMILPPPFFSYDIQYTKKGEQDALTLDDLSSGEKQMIFTVSAAIEHLANLSSISTNDTNRVAYHHVNLIFDEAELYFHPEYQRSFITKLISILSSGFIDKRRIRSVNVLIVTHSPYLLSDIPHQNILFLKERGSRPQGPTFAANIYDLLKGGFFMNSGIGEFATSKIKRIFEVYQLSDFTLKKELFNNEKDDFKFTVSIIGDPYLKETVERLINEMEVQ